ncbi:serine/threonine-protein kinase [Streptomyces sp. S.PB5]|uniref:serine/threonine-protein kinase n=1 Tax=Streptomyces sp. S.PB5 TaxID=3020844 RepID=UPI0025B00E65|nr:serine/threonine-protein kinase [Streptomyces sp. S.PB5]MDN3024567.1 serine/threonine-protein kinase [Streptomyces sp. S.PB5]
MQGLLLAGRYRLADTIGSGGMGRVWRAHDEVLHRAVAIKELTAALYVSESDQERLLHRTRAEARAAARINHSAVVTVHDVLDHDARPWIVMELVEGGSLADAVKERGRIEPAEAARIGLWVLRALRAAHSAGVLHRDVKPGNVLLSHDGRVLLTDFGIAQIEGDTTITRTGEVVGSVDYLAPERVRGHDPGPASDLWALGATIYTAVEGRSPFRRTSPLGTMQAVVEEEPAEPVNAGALGPVLAALLRKDPAERPAAAEAEQMLAEAVEGRWPSGAQAYAPTARVRYETGTGSGAGFRAGPHTGSPTGPPATSPTGPPTGSPTGPPTGSGTTAQTAAATPYPPVSAQAQAQAPAPFPAPTAPRKRHRLRTFALVVALAAIVGGAGAVALQQFGAGSTPSDSVSSGPSVSATPSPSPSASATPSGTGGQGTIPADWVPYDGPGGSSIRLPEGWKQSVTIDKDGIKQFDYSPDNGRHVVRVAVDTSPDFPTSYAHMKDLEPQLSGLQNYERLSLTEALFRDLPGARWEYTWDALAKDPPHYVTAPYRAIDVGYMDRDGTEYAIYAASPAADWATTRKQFNWILQSWQPKTP